MYEVVKWYEIGFNTSCAGNISLYSQKDLQKWGTATSQPEPWFRDKISPEKMTSVQLAS